MNSTIARAFYERSNDGGKTWERMDMAVHHPAAPPMRLVPRTTPLDVASDATFERWCASTTDLTLSEFAAFEYTNRPSGPPPAPPNRLVAEGVQPSRPWPRR